MINKTQGQKRKEAAKFSKAAHRVIRGSGISGAEQNKSMYEILAQALVKNGAPSLTGCAKAFCIKNSSMVYELSKSIGKNRAISASHSKKSKQKDVISIIKITIINGIDVASDAFLGTYEWRTLRMVAIKKYGRTCACCGIECGKNGVVLNVDHIKPRRKYPELALELSNLQILCATCNHGKGSWDETDWRAN